VIDWVMRAEGVSFRHAVELLRDGMPAMTAAGRVPGRPTVRKLASPLDRSAADDELLGQVIGYYHRVLRESPDALGYLARRKIGHPEAVDTFRLGYADRSLGLRLPDKRRKDGAEIRGRLTALGIFRASGHEHFAGSLVIPVFDENGKMAEVYGRKTGDRLRAGTPKHLYLPGPHRGVWNAQALAASDEVIVCESLIDALSFWCAGVPARHRVLRGGRVHRRPPAGVLRAPGAAGADRLRPRRRRRQGRPRAGRRADRDGDRVLLRAVPRRPGRERRRGRRPQRTRCCRSCRRRTGSGFRR
jgi:hypothetical protein